MLRADTKKIRERIFQIGEQVWLYNPAVKQGVSKMLSSLWRGPYTIIDHVGDVIYRIQLIGSTQTLIVHGNYAMVHLVNNCLGRAQGPSRSHELS